MKNIIYISDFPVASGSGYGNIAVQLCMRLQERDMRTLILGLGYRGEEHGHPFAVVPATPPRLAVMVSSLVVAPDVKFSAIIAAMDIPRQESFRKAFGQSGPPLPHIGIYPLESAPLCDSWAMSLMALDASLVISEFGATEAIRAGVDAQYLPIGIDTTLWRIPAPEERVQIRENLGIAPSVRFVLTVADNHERKNLTAAMEIIAALRQRYPKVSILYGLVTRPDLSIGYKLMDYAVELGLGGCIQIWKRGLAEQALWGLYAAADAFLLTSKAEGLGMPVMEAMATGTPVVGTDCAAIKDHLSDGRGYLIPVAHKFRDVWGNAWRHLVDVDQGAILLESALNGHNPERLRAARDYVKGFTWEGAVEVLAEAIDNVS